MRQIELMSQAIAALLKKLMGLKTDKTEEKISQLTDELLKEHLDLTLPDLLTVTPKEITSVITRNKGIDNKNAELLAEVLVLNADACTESKKRTKLLETALELINWSDSESNTFS
ncbi:MAG: hypothetical protein PVF73_11560, partial [Bacteroidales bacterium]